MGLVVAVGLLLEVDLKSFLSDVAWSGFEEGGSVMFLYWLLRRTEGKSRDSFMLEEGFLLLNLSVEDMSALVRDPRSLERTDGIGL